MAYDEELAERIRAALGDRADVSERKMFGGLSFMLRGNMCCGVDKTNLMVRVGSEAYDEALAQPGARLMDFTGRPMKGISLRLGLKSMWGGGSNGCYPRTSVDLSDLSASIDVALGLGFCFDRFRIR